MQSLRTQITKYPFLCLRVLRRVQKKHDLFQSACYYATNDIETFTKELVDRIQSKQKGINESTPIKNLLENGKIKTDVSRMSIDDINNIISHLLTKNSDNLLEKILSECVKSRKFIGEINLKKLFKHYSVSGKTEMISVLQSYCLQSDKVVYDKNCEFEHYQAKAQCFKGNSDKGLSILRQCYEKNENLRSLYRIVFRELIQDTVMHRSEASLVIFKKYVLEFSKTWSDHYPLICFWHICWSSSWFSDQQLADELLESSEALKAVIQDRATAFSITILREEYNEDAVMRLLQTLLKYEMMDEYVKVLQVLFNYKMKYRDIRGCSEIIKNCEILGISLPAASQGKYIKMLIQGKPQQEQNLTDKLTSKNFKFKF